MSEPGYYSAERTHIVKVEVVQIGRVLYRLLVPSIKVYGDITIENLKDTLDWYVERGLVEKIIQAAA